MPHQCTECGRVFPDGSKEMLSGCPNCGGNTFQFKPEDDASDEEVADPPDGESTVTETVSRATKTVRDWVTDRNSTDRPAGRPSGPSGSADRDRSPESVADRDDSERPDGEAGPPDLGSTGDYPEWPNPDGADTSGVGKGPSARRERAPSRDGSKREQESSREGSTREQPPRSDDSTDRSTPDEFEWTDDPASHEGTSEETSESRPEPDWDTDRIRARTEDREDDAQASARSDVVTPDELPGPTAAGGSGPSVGNDDAPPEIGPVSSDSGDRNADQPVGPLEESGTPTDVESADSRGGRVVDTPSEEDRPDLDELREELNDQFESIKIVSPGQYELNLMELYDRDEYIISLREDGRYVIEVAESWRDDE